MAAWVRFCVRSTPSASTNPDPSGEEPLQETTHTQDTLRRWRMTSCRSHPPPQALPGAERCFLLWEPFCHALGANGGITGS